MDLFDIFQQGQIRQARRDAEEARHEVRAIKGSNRTQEGQIKSMGLILEALWELLKENTNLDNVDLMHKIQEVDLRDGVKDGRNNERASTCLGCGKKISNRFEKCLYCETPNNHYNPFIDL